MSSVIHGKSHQVLKFLHKRPAALAVLWIYASRTNYEGVAWPSIRGLMKDTGWTVCDEARDYLVEHGALERVEGYIRPQWRKLSLDERTRKINLDKSQYYRVTGVFVQDGIEYPVFYHGANEAIDTENDPSDVGRSSTSDVVDHGPGATELNTNGELDSKKIKLTTTTNGRGSHREENDRASTIGAVYAAYENMAGTITPHIRDEIQAALIDTPAEWLIDAIHIAEEHNKRFWAYVKGILKTWKEKGRDNPPKPSNGSASSAAPSAAKRVYDPATNKTAYYNAERGIHEYEDGDTTQFNKGELL
jgi:DnaD/phage-associated family protein